MKWLLNCAYREHFAFPACNFENFEMLEGIVQGASNVNSPIIVQTTEPAISHLGLRRIVYMVNSYMEEYSIPIVLHLDHAKNIQLIQDCIDAGYTSVMVDYSDCPIDENIKKVQSIIDYAKRNDVAVEAEVGFVGSELYASELTNIQQVSYFLNKAPVDALAVSLGNEHGGKQRTKLLNNFLLQELSQVVSIPLVLHGSSGVITEEIIGAIHYGICKINIETELRMIFKAAIEEYYRNECSDIKPRNLMTYTKNMIAKNVEKKCIDYGCANTLKNAGYFGK